MESLAFKAQREAAQVLERTYTESPADPRGGLDAARNILEAAIKKIQKRPKSAARTSMCTKLFAYKAEIKLTKQKGGPKPLFASQGAWNAEDNDFLLRWIDRSVKPRIQCGSGKTKWIR